MVIPTIIVMIACDKTLAGNASAIDMSWLPDGIPMSAATLDKFGVASFVKLVRVTVSMHRTMQQGSRLFPLKGARVVKKGTYGDLLL